MIGVGKAKQYGNVLDKPLAKGKQEVSLSAFAFLFSELVQYNQTQVDNIGELERRLEDAGYAVGARVLELLCHRDKGNRRETRLLGILSFVHSTVWKVLFGKPWQTGKRFCGILSEKKYPPCTLEKKIIVDVNRALHDKIDYFIQSHFDCSLLKVVMVGFSKLVWVFTVILSMLGWLDHHDVMFTYSYKESPIIDETLVLDEPVADSLEKGTEHEDEYMISEKELLVNKFISIPKDMGTFNCGAFVAGIVRGVLDGAGFPAVVTAHFVPMEGQQRPRTTILIKFAEEVLQREARLG
ncbi:hypothetical protein LR48_Vigan03g252100 [Vigna angularis]|uniref:Trafficking protein particle complex subunit n=2 Tax=Phaseolus angularis TaxID=3914 RepID=A0A0L9U9F2_PHAAN|nr:hypothetical protein LR48_Vigan03g252100 [Vigna angularis]